MKHSVFSLLLLLCSTIVFTNTTNAQLKVKRICFFDDFGGTYFFNHIQDLGNDTYSAKGTYDGYPDGKATLWFDLSRGRDFGIAEVHAINGSPDGCNTYSDSFVLHGTFLILNGEEENYYLLGGTWQSYCFGTVLFVGSWAGIGPCKNFTSRDINKNVSPSKGNSSTKPKDDDFSLKIIPNPVKSSVQLEYKLTSAGKVNITIYDFMHQPIKMLINETKTPGTYSLSWNVLNSNGARVPPGLYKVVASVNGKVYSNTIQVAQ